MGESERLMQRFVDNELTAEERIRLVRVLEHDKALKRRLLDTEVLIIEAGQLPRFMPPADFLTGIRNRLPASKTGDLACMAEVLFARRIFHWNLAAAIGIGILLLTMVWCWFQFGAGQ